MAHFRVLFHLQFQVLLRDWDPVYPDFSLPCFNLIVKNFWVDSVL